MTMSLNNFCQQETVYSKELEYSMLDSTCDRFRLFVISGIL